MFNRQNKTMARLDGTKLFLLASLMLVPTIVKSTPPVGAELFKSVVETHGFENGLPILPCFTPDGKTVLFLRSGPRDMVLRLFQMDVQSGVTSELISPEALLKGAAESLSPEEKARRERQRESHQGFTSFQLSKNGRQVLLSLSGRSYVMDLAKRGILALPGTNWLDPKLSPDGRYVAAVSGGELHVLEPATGRDFAVTSGATKCVTHGLAEFVAQEELNRSSGYWWSPDSGSLVFEEADSTGVERGFLSNPLDPTMEPVASYYPKAGKSNASLQLGIVPVSGGMVKWIKWDHDHFPYIAQVQWPEHGNLTIQLLTRDQRELQLLAVAPHTGETTLLLSEKDTAWVNTGVAGQMPIWLPSGDGFLWGTERRGCTQVELRDKSGALLRELTPVGFEVGEVDDFDPLSGTIILSGGNDTREKHLYRASLNNQELTRFSKGVGVHDVLVAQNHATYLESLDLLDGTRDFRVNDEKGKLLARIPSVAETSPLVVNLEHLRVGKDRTFDTCVIRPANFKTGHKYPVILDVYAGPQWKYVMARRSQYFTAQWRANQGFIVVQVDGRGTPNQGRAWERAIKGNFIDIALVDQIAGLRLLGNRIPEMDMKRVGVVGWSFGGYFAAMATIRRPDVFTCGIAGAPVTDWLDYDSTYTERYLDTPAANPEGYKRSSVMTYVDKLSRPLLIIHGMADDNVSPAHSLKLMDALLRAGKSFEFLPMVGAHHPGATDPILEMRLANRMMDFFKYNLKPRLP